MANTLGEFIRERRKSKEYSQERLAELLDEKGARVGQMQVSFWETDRRIPSAVQYVALCDVLRFTLDEQVAANRFLLNSTHNGVKSTDA